MECKKCIKCGRMLPLTDFYIHKQMADGRLNKCKECTKTYTKENRKKNIEKYREYDRQRSKLEKRKRPNGRRSKLQMKAYNALARAVASGKKKRPEVCERCGRSCFAQAHHDDYTKPLDVMWLCGGCHSIRHSEIGRLGHHKPRKPSDGAYPSRPNGRTLKETIELGCIEEDTQGHSS